jgi:hypothetical protein
MGLFTERKSWVIFAAGVCCAAGLWSQRQPTADILERFKKMTADAEAKGLAEPFKGIRTAQGIEPNLFSIRSTGVSTEPVRKAAEAFLASLNAEQRKKSTFDVDDDEWRKWMNQHFYRRQGVSFEEMSETQRGAAFSLMKASLSAKGLQLSRDIMRLNYTLGELNKNNFVEYGEWLYSITVMGTPSRNEPWGWQVDGHHLIVNYFVLGVQVVMTPSFFGSEPALASEGKYKGTVVLQDEQNKGLKFVNALTEEQRAKAVLKSSKPGNNNVGEAFKDNVVLDYAGLPGKEMTAAQKEQLSDLVWEYVRNTDDGHAKIKMNEVRQHLDGTYFAWIGATDEKAVFYYRIHSPVVLIEFDHQTPANLRHLYPNVPYKEHIHAVIRTPNGNDYGKDLLRQHYLKHPHPHKH